MPGAAGSGGMDAPVDPGSEPAPPPANEPQPQAPPVNPPANETPPANPPPTNEPPANPPAVGTGSGCAPGAAFFCEDFEASAVGTAQANDSWRPEGNVSVDDEQGSRALHVQAQAGQNARILVQNFAPPNNSFFGRINMFVEQFPTAPDNAHFVLVEVTGDSGERVRPIGGQFKQGVADVSIWGVGADGGATGDWTDWQPTAPTVSGQWVCMEWQMNASDNSVDVFIDGVQKPELHASTNQHGGNQTAFNFPAFNNISLGWVVFQGGAQPSQYDVWLDDIVLSTERVGCN